MYVRYLSRILGCAGFSAGAILSAAVVGTIVLAAGCAAVRVPTQPVAPTPMDPVWNDAELRDHLTFLNSGNVMGRATGTQGYARAAAYVTARMREFRLQPAVDDDFRIVYPTSVNFPASSRLRTVGLRDSTTYLAGIDYVPDALSDSGSVRVDRLVVAADDPARATIPSEPFGIVVPEGASADLRAWRNAGARIALVVSALRPRFEPAPIRNLLVTQITPGAASRLFAVPLAELDGYLSDFDGEVIELPQMLLAQIGTEYQPRAGAINILSYISGKDPVKRRELIVLCADLDAMGHFAGVSAIDYGNFGISTAAVMEVARNLSYVSRRWTVPDRSVMIAIWSGSQVGHAGLRDFLENPTWPLDRIGSVVYVGLSSDEEADVREMLGDVGIPLTVIRRPEEPLFDRDVVLVPSPSVQRLARERDPTAPVLERPNASALMDSAILRARRLGDSAYRNTMLQATDAATFFPARRDSIPPPALVDTE
ncbi:MAG: hypothetical protein WD021_09335 [Rhodothermales bacterium]